MMERTVLEESWRRNGPVGPSLEVIDDDDYIDISFSRLNFVKVIKNKRQFSYVLRNVKICS
jgi:hypothetical protein